MSLPMVVLSPPGMISPSSPASCSGRRTSTASAPSSRRRWACSRKAPWRARTPILMADLPAAASQQLFLGDGADLQTGHGLAQALGHFDQDLGVVEVGGGLDDGLGVRRRVAGLEDAGAHEHAVA